MATTNQMLNEHGLSVDTAQQAMSRQGLEELSKALANLGTSKYETTNVDVVNEGTQIILPEKMTAKEGIECLQRKIKEEETVISIHEEVDAFALEGAFAFMKVLQARYGWAEPVPRKGFFGDTPPTLVNLEIAHGVQTQVIWGDFKVPGIDGKLTTSITKKNNRPIFVLSGQVRQRHKAEIKEIADQVRAYVVKNSIYKGKALRLRTDDNGNPDLATGPGFLDLSRVNPDELTFSQQVAEQVQTNLFTPIENTAKCREYGIPLKRGVLLEGRYGTGKTLTAYVTAKKCEENKWTFIYLDRVGGLKTAIEFAKQYSPAVIFAEDVDRAVAGERSVEIDDVLNTIDGIDSKGAEIITILTSNHVENINKAMLRPGRLDAVISVLAPDAAAAERLVRIYARGLIDINENLSEAGRELDGQIPAVIREVVERSKLYAIGHIKEGMPLKLTGRDLAAAARGMKSHLALMETPKSKELSPEQALGVSLSKLIASGLDVTFGEKFGEKIDSIHEYCQ